MKKRVLRKNKINWIFVAFFAIFYICKKANAKNVLWNSSHEFWNKTCINRKISSFWAQGYATLMGPTCGCRVMDSQSFKNYEYLRLLRLWKPITRQPQVGPTKVAYHCVQNDEIFRLIQVLLQNSCEEFHRTFLALAFRNLRNKEF